MASPDESAGLAAASPVGVPLPSTRDEQAAGIVSTPGSSAGSDDRPTLLDGSAGSASPPVESFGPYEILEKIAEGGMGVVLRARDRKLGREVALKRIRSGPLARAEEIERFDLEARAIAQLRHDHIIEIYHFDQI